MIENGFEFTELDRKIIDILKHDGRTSNQKIADNLGVNTSQIASRIRKMEKANAMKIIAVSDFAALDYNVLLPIGVDVKGRPAKEVAQDLAQIDEVASVQLVCGSHEIELLVTLSDLDNLSDFLLGKLSQVKGVRSLSPSFACLNQTNVHFWASVYIHLCSTLMHTHVQNTLYVCHHFKQKYP